MKYYIYTDGSYKKVQDLGAWGAAAATITLEGSSKPDVVLTKVFRGDILSMNNVAGELVAVMMAVEHCIKTLHVGKDDELRVYHDYQGIDAWCRRAGENGYWRAKNKYTQNYRNYINDKVKTRTNITFIHVKGHSGVEGNVLVDHLAYDSLNQHLDRLRAEKYEQNL